MPPLDAIPAQRLWDMSDDEFWAYAREQAGGDSASPTTEEQAQAGQYLECVLRQGTYLLPLAAIEEVMPAPSPARYALLPSIPRWMPGLAAWRGEVAVIVNLEAYLTGSAAPTGCGMLLFTHHEGLALGLFVPALGQAVTLEEERGASVLDIAALQGEVTRQLGTAARYA
jgi:chemotaxis signal transduction protein